MSAISDKAIELGLRQEKAKRLARRSFLHFCLYVSPHFRSHWHIVKIAQAVDEIVFGDLRRLFLAMPPQIGKSTIMSIHFPAFVLGVKPETRIMGASYGALLAAHFNKEVQALISTDAYKELFPETTLRRLGAVSDDMTERTQTVFRVVGKRGGLRSFGTQGSATGFSADGAIIDDAHKDAKEADSEKKREAVFSFFRGTLTPRLQSGAFLAVVGTRWNLSDFLSFMLEQAQSAPKDQKWRVIVLPAIKEGPPSPEDPREEGEALCPWRYTVDDYQTTKRIIGSRQFNALYQQNPTPDEGSIVKIGWFRYYEHLPDQIDRFVISADLTFGDQGDFTVLTCWAAKGADRYLVDLIRNRMTFTEQIRAFQGFCQRWPQADAKLVEDAANGAALIDTLRGKIPGIIAVRAKDAKHLRLGAVAPQIEAGNVFLPTGVRLLGSQRGWVDDFLEEFRVFPNGQHDDQVDSTSQALIYMRDHSLTFDFKAVNMRRESPFAYNLDF